MTTGAKLGIGTKIEYETTPGASPVAFTNVPQVLDVPALNRPRESVETTNQDSLNFTREYIPGLQEPPEFTFECNYLPNNADQIALDTMFNQADGGRRQFRIRETTSSPEVTWTFEAFVVNFAPQAPIADRRTVEITIRITGPITRA